MLRSSTATIALGIGLLAAMPAALAQTSPATPGQPVAQPGGATQHESQAEIRSVGQAPVSLSQAIADAETNAGGRAVDAMFAIEGGTPFYAVKTYGNGALRESRIDANTGRLIGPRQSTPEEQLTATQRAQLSQLQNARDTLAQAIVAAEQCTGGKAIDAVLAAGQGGKLSYHVQTVKNGGADIVMVDPQDGRIASVEAQPRESSGSSVPPAPAATLPHGASTDKSLGEPPPGSTRQNLPLPK